MRQRPDDEHNRDLRIFPSWKDMDWSDPSDIAQLNKYRDQLFSRTSGEGKIGAPWTQKEREVLEEVLTEILESGDADVNTSTLDVSLLFLSSFCMLVLNQSLLKLFMLLTVVSLYG